MHQTIVKLKDGTELTGSIHLFRPAEGYISLFGHDGRIDFNMIESAITLNERISINKIGDMDELERARKDIAMGRLHKWDGYPDKLFAWENCTHCGKPELKVIPADEPWHPEQLQCLNCDSTFIY